MMTTSHHRTSHGPTWLVAIVSVLFASSARAVEPATVRAWLESERAAVEAWPGIPDGVVFEFRETFYSMLTLEGVNKLRAQIKGHPDHPGRARVEQYDRMLSLGPRVSEYAIRGNIAGGIRIGQDSINNPSGAFRDTVIDGDRAWGLTEDHLTIIDISNGWPSTMRLDGEISVAEGAVRNLIFGPVFTLKSLRLAIQHVEVADDGKHWEALAVGAVSWRYRGVWDDEAGFGFIDSAEVVSSDPAPENVGFGVTCSGWAYSELLGRPVLATIESRHPDGTVFRRMELLDIRPMSQSKKAILATPEIDGEDILRGEILVDRVFDFTGDVYTQQTHIDGGVDSSVIGYSDSGKSASLLRVTGWTVFAGLVVLFFVLRTGKK